MSDSEFRAELLASKLPLSSYCDMFFSPFESVDQYDSVYDPGNMANTGRLSADYDSPYWHIEDFVRSLQEREPRTVVSLFLNIRSIPQNIDEFLTDFSISSLRYDILCMSETRLLPSMEPLFNIPNFDFFGNSRNTRGGGIAIYVNKKIQVYNG